MPIYDWKNTETGETEEHLVFGSQLEQFQKDNPHLVRQDVVTINTGDPIRLGLHKAPEVFRKEILGKAKAAHPLGTVEV